MGGRGALLAVLAVAAGCAREADTNLAAGRKAFDRLAIGMSHEDACWFGGFSSAKSGESEYSYQTDFGRTFSRKEVVLTVSIRDGTLARVVLTRPRYEGENRRDDGAEIIAEKGALPSAPAP